MIDEEAGSQRGLGDRVFEAAVYAAFGLSFTLVFLSLSHPTLSLGSFLLGAVTFCGACGLALARGVLAAERPARHWHWPLIVAAVYIAATVACYATDAPVRARFVASESAFQRAVDALPPPGSAKQISVPSHIGLFAISRADAHSDGYLFYDADGGDFSDTGAGIAYLPRGVTGSLPQQDAFTHLKGPWYAWIGYS